MRTAWHHLWGSARGPLTGAAPETRLLAGAVVFATVMTAPVANWAGTLLAAGVVLAWLVACRPPGRLVGSAVLFGLALFLPYFLLVPWIDDGPGTGWPQRLLVPWTVLCRGLAGMLVCLSTVACLSASDLREALARFPVPRVLAAIVLQIVQQTATLLYETRRVANAMAVRGACSRGVAAWRVACSLPRVWLPRIVARADRVATAMELRGYCDQDPRSAPARDWHLLDVAMLAPATLGLILAVVLRVKA